MKFLEPLDDILGQQAKIKILRSLVLKGAELSGRQIAEEARLSHTGIHNALKDLVASHVIQERRAGKALLFKLNQENYLVREMLKPLFARENSLFELALKATIKRIPVPIISLVLFGSLAQKRETPGSDIDLMVIVSPQHKAKAAEAFDKISNAFLSLYGKTISPYIITVKEFQNKYRQRTPFIIEVVKTGIVMQGKLISEILRHGR